jgi:hypothetical protein
VADPKLAAPAGNAGPTETQALATGSGARGAIPGSSGLCSGVDQRGVARPANDCDIGAYQASPPTATTGDATALTATGATVAASVVANDPSASVAFQYGTTASYGSSVTSSSSPAGVTATGVSASLTGLAPATTYHYRVVATNRDGTTSGIDQTFTTTAASPGSVTGPGTGPGSATGRFAGLTVKRQTLRLSRRGAASVNVLCPASTVGACTGTLRLTIRVRVVVRSHGKRRRVLRTVTLGSIRFKVAAGRHATLAVKLTRAATARVKRARSLRATGTAAASDGLRRRATTTALITLRPWLKPSPLRRSTRS